MVVKIAIFRRGFYLSLYVGEGNGWCLQGKFTTFKLGAKVWCWGDLMTASNSAFCQRAGLLDAR